MPTENRSSNTEMVSVPREPTAEMLAAAKKSGVIDPRVSGYCYALMVAAAPTHPGEPVAYLTNAGKSLYFPSPNIEVMPGDKPLFTHADPGEVERLSQVIRDLNDERDEIGAEVGRLRAQLAERDALLREALEFIDDGVGRSDAEWQLIQKLRSALSASAEPSAPVEIDERASFEYHHRVCDLVRDEDCPEDYRNQSVQDSWEGWQARAALERKPS